MACQNALIGAVKILIFYRKVRQQKNSSSNIHIVPYLKYFIKQ